jgi:hypothetical protein
VPARRNINSSQKKSGGGLWLQPPTTRTCDTCDDERSQAKGRICHGLVPVDTPREPPREPLRIVSERISTLFAEAERGLLAPAGSEGVEWRGRKFVRPAWNNLRQWHCCSRIWCRWSPHWLPA